MKFEQRKAMAREMVWDFLDAFSPPRGMAAEQLDAKVNFIADAFARRMPVAGDYAEMVEGVFAKLRDSHETNTWPAQAAFVNAMPVGERRMKGAQETYRPDNEPDVIAKRMAQGLGVPERWVWRDAARLAGKVDAQTLDAYRKASARSFREAYREEAEQIATSKHGEQVWEYFA